MFKKKSLIIIASLSLLLLIGCVKAAKDIVDDIEASAACAQRLTAYSNNNNSDKTCAQITSEINGILEDCGEFLSQDEIDNLNFAKDNCTDD